MSTRPTRLLLRADALWSGDGVALERPGRVLLEGERIVAVGAQDQPADTTVVDLPGCTLLPGLIDMHGHCRLNALEPDPSAQIQEDPVRYTLRSIANLQRDLRAGVTTVKTNGDRDFLDVGLRQAFADQQAVGPRLFVASRGIKAPECTAGRVATSFCRGPDQIRVAVAENLARGADHIKLFVSGGLMLAVEEACQAFYSREEIRAAVEVAEAAGSFVTAHCTGGPTADWCAEAGVRVLEHGYYLTDEQLERLRQAGTWLDLTLGVGFHPRGHGPELVRHGLDPRELAERERLARDSARRAIASGVRFLFGTDGMHGLLAYEAEQAAALGAAPAEVLAALTVNPAGVIGRGDELGRLAPGALADLVAVAGDPLADLSALWQVRAVYRAGVAVDLAPPPVSSLS